MDGATLTWINWVSWSIPFLAGGLYFLLKSNNDKRKKNQKKFISEVNQMASAFHENPPSSRKEVETRKQLVKNNIPRLSYQIFGQEEPEFTSIRSEKTVYPKLDCKWCSEMHQPESGSLGKCSGCKLPLDVWIGCQGAKCD